MTTMPKPSTQRGAALITGLIFMVVLTLIVLSAMKSTALEERMAGNARDQELAFEAAEAAAREAMQTVVPTLSPASFPALADGCISGLCQNNSATPVWETVAANDDWTDAGVTRAYAGTPLTSDGSAVLPVQPHYIIELLPLGVPPPGFSSVVGQGGSGGGQLTPYRVTARGWGVTGQAMATVQMAILY
jgi:type IV pilus assembly protein PilX